MDRILYLLWKGISFLCCCARITVMVQNMWNGAAFIKKKIQSSLNVIWRHWNCKKDLLITHCRSSREPRIGPFSSISSHMRATLLFALVLVKQWLKTFSWSCVIFLVNAGKPVDTSCLNEHSLFPAALWPWPFSLLLW